MRGITFVSVALLVSAVCANSDVQAPKNKWDVRIINGRRAKLGQFPFQAFITVTTPYITFPCGGSLISPRWVLTSAQCTQGANSFTVRLGSLVSDKGGVLIPSSTAITHENYNKEPNVNNGNFDIALINLDFAPVLSDTIQPIKLLPASMTVLNKLRISGWGATSDDPNWSVSPFLQFADVTQVDYMTCVKTYPFLTTNTACTVGSPEDPSQSSCDGDGGGPVVLAASGRGGPYLVGVISFGSDAGCTQGLPVGHTRIVPFLPWIFARTPLRP